MASNDATMVDNTADSGETEMYKDAEIWFDDGNVVIVAGPGAPVPGREVVKGGDIWGFKCHKSILAKNSVVFADMFGVSASSTQQLLDGVPIVALSDKWEDVRDLLRSFYSAFELPTVFRHPENTSRIAGILRLSKKYMVDELWAKAIKIFERDWPSTLSGWLAAVEASEEIALKAAYETPFEHNYDDETAFDVCKHWPDPVDTITLARELEISSVLPAAFYDLNRTYFALYIGQTWDNATRYRSVMDPKLDFHDFKQLSKGRESIRNHVRYHLGDGSNEYWLSKNTGSWPPRSLCSGTKLDNSNVQSFDPKPPPPCWPKIKAWQLSARQTLLANSHEVTTTVFVDPIHHLNLLWRRLGERPLKEQWDHYPRATDICHNCHVWYEGCIYGMMDDIWTNLPQFFELVEPAT